MPARKNLRPIVEDLSARSIEGRKRRRLTTGSSDLKQARIPASQQYLTIGAPGAATCADKIADFLQRGVFALDPSMIQVVSIQILCCAVNN